MTKGRQHNTRFNKKKTGKKAQDDKRMVKNEVIPD
jgi:hypothetical protein